MAVFGNLDAGVPDAPVSRFELQLKGGKKFGLIENSANLCAKAQRAAVAFAAQNGARLNQGPAIARQCGKGTQKSKAKKGAKRG